MDRLKGYMMQVRERKFCQHSNMLHVCLHYVNSAKVAADKEFLAPLVIMSE